MTVSIKFATNHKEVKRTRTGGTGLPRIAAQGAIRAVCILALFATLMSCTETTPKPEDSLKTFLGAVRTKRGKLAWDLLSAKTQTELNRRAMLIAEATQTPVKTKANDLLFEQLEMMAIRIPESISVASPISSTARLRVSMKNGDTATIEMIREDVGWKVDLFRSLTPVRTATTTVSSTKTQ